MTSSWFDRQNSSLLFLIHLAAALIAVFGFLDRLPIPEPLGAIVCTMVVIALVALGVDLVVPSHPDGWQHATTGRRLLHIAPNAIIGMAIALTAIGLLVHVIRGAIGPQTGRTTSPNNEDPSVTRSAGASQDVRFFAYSSRARGTSEVFVMDLRGPLSRRIAEGRDAAVSADGRIVAWVTESNDRPLLSIKVGDQKPVTYDVGAGLSSIAISPGGDRLAFVVASEGGGQDVVVRDLGSTSSELVAGSSSNESDPSWASDGQQIVLVESGSSGDSIQVRDWPSAETTWSSRVNGDVLSPSLCPGSDRLAFIASVGGNREVLVTNLSSDAEPQNVSLSSEQETGVLCLGQNQLITSTPSSGLRLISTAGVVLDQLTATPGDTL